MATPYIPYKQGQNVNNSGGGGFAGAFSNALNQAQPYNMSGGSSAPPPPQYQKPVQQQPPQYSQQPSSHHLEAPPRGCRDLPFAILFYGHLAGMIFAAAKYGPKMALSIAGDAQNLYNFGGDNNRRVLQEEEGGDGGAEDYEDFDFEMDPRALTILVCLAGVLGLIMSSLAMGFMITFAEGLIKFALWFNIILFAAVGVFSLMAGAMPVGLVFLVLAGISALYAYRVWSRIPFAASNLVTAVTAVRANMGLAVYAYWSVALLFLWSILWTISSFSTVYVLGECDAGEGACEGSVSGILIFLFILSFYWTSQVISNVVHVTTAGTVGTWWFHPEEATGCCSQAVRESYVRSLTTSFGSICLGSLLVAIIQTIKEMVRSAQEGEDSVVACIATCILGCIESLVEYFNKWAFCYVGLYGFSFMEAGKNVMNLFRERGWTAIISDLMVDAVLGMVALGVGLLTAVVTLIIGAAMGSGGVGTLGPAFFLGFIVAYAMCATLFSVISSGVNTVIVCYAEAPAEFQANHPELATRMRESWQQAFPNDFHY